MEEAKSRQLTWIKLYEETHDAGLVCRRCGISRPTLRKWLQRYEALGAAGLHERSRRPHTSPTQKVGEREEGWIRELRHERNLGARRIQHELMRLHHCSLSLAVIHKVLKRLNVPPLRNPRRPVVPKRYSMALPGERVQMDTMKVAAGRYQYTFIDDCTRYVVLALYPRRTAANTLDFLERVLEEIPFPIQRLQTDNGTEFTSYVVRDFLMQRCIKHRPIPPRTPHLNGKVERVQKTVVQEFYALADLASVQLDDELGVWQTDYNYRRTHGSLGKTPVQHWKSLNAQTPYWEDIAATFDPQAEAAFHRQLTLDRRRKVLAKK